MTSRRDRRDDGGFSWPPTQDDLDALDVLGVDGRAPAFSRAPRQRRGRDEPSADAPHRILPEHPTIVPPSTSIGNVPPPKAQRDRDRVGRAVTLNHLTLLASGIVIGLALAIVVGLRQPPTAVVATGPAVRPAAGVRIEPTPTTAPVRSSPPETAFAATLPAPPPAPASGSGTLRAATLAAMPPSGPPLRPLRDAAPRRALVTSSAAARVTSAPGVRGPSATPDAPATDELAADVARPDSATPADMLEAVPGPGLGGVSASLAAAVPEPTPSAAAPSIASSARPLIVDVLQRYQAAYSSMDVGAARAVWPSVDGRALERAFGTLKEQELALGACNISIDQDRATAVCPGTVRYRPKVGNTAPQRRNGQWEVQLDRGARGWAITGVNVR